MLRGLYWYEEVTILEDPKPEVVSRFIPEVSRPLDWMEQFRFDQLYGDRDRLIFLQI